MVLFQVYHWLIKHSGIVEQGNNLLRIIACIPVYTDLTRIPYFYVNFSSDFHRVREINKLTFFIDYYFF
jgi:hypothetical protein